MIEVSSTTALKVPNVSRETEGRLIRFEALIKKWSPSINLVSKSDIAQLRERHITDSLQLATFLPSIKTEWLDVGTGGGFPGMVLAIAASEIASETHFTFVESDSRKATFLRTAIRELSLSATVINERIELMTPSHADIMSARALAPLDTLLGYARRHLTPKGSCFFLKGKSFEDEVDAARQNWSFELKTHTSCTDPSARVLEISNLHHV